MKNNVELLAPAGNWDAMVAAVQNGADSVYLGGSAFNAREYADNFNENELARAVEYCHRRDVNIFITLNTLIHQREFKDVIHFLSFLCKQGVDGIIIQDMGLVKVITEEYHEIPIHGSTQMTIHNLPGAQKLEQMGFHRVVLARELSLKEIEYIKENTQIELETFIHGALCVSYSGQCLMSSWIGGRSGNRGKCAQPCRLPYELVQKSDNRVLGKGYLLSTKDLETITYLDQIIKSGVKSLKIEGRMKRPEYVAVVVQKYRKALDYIWDKRNDMITQDDMVDLMKIFHRGGFTKGYYFGINENELMSHQRPNHWGIPVGKIIKVNKKENKGSLQLLDSLSVGDGIVFRNEHNEKGGMAVTYMEKHEKGITEARKGDIAVLPIPVGVSKNDRVYKTTDIKQLEDAQMSYKKGNKRLIPIEGKITLRINELPILELMDHKGISILSIGEKKIEAAQFRPISDEEIHKQIGKLGETPFTLSELKIDRDKNAWISIKSINELRRHAVNSLILKRLETLFPGYTCKNEEQIINGIFQITQNNPVPKNKKLIIQIPEIAYSSMAFDAGADIVYIAPLSFTDNTFHEADMLNYYRGIEKECFLVIPVITKDADLEVIDNLLARYSQFFDGIVIGNIGSLKMARKYFPNRVYGDYPLNIINGYASLKFREIGFGCLTLSTELTLYEIRDIMAMDAGAFECVVHGRIPLMHLAHCPIKAVFNTSKRNKNCFECQWQEQHSLKDRKGYEFPISRIHMNQCITQILNSQTLCMAEHFERLSDMNIQNYRIIFQKESREEMINIIGVYRNLLDNMPLSSNMINILDQVKNRGITYGHYFRGVI